MRLSRVHLDFWQAKKATPAWADSIGPKRLARWKPPPFNIHACVNAHAGLTFKDGSHGAGNTLALIRLRVKAGLTLAQALQDLNNCPSSPRREADARKWRNRLQRPYRK